MYHWSVAEEPAAEHLQEADKGFEVLAGLGGLASVGLGSMQRFRFRGQGAIERAPRERSSNWKPKAGEIAWLNARGFKDSAALGLHSPEV